MRTLYHQDIQNEVKRRLARLTPANQRQWGKMSSAQMLKHCSGGMEMALGHINPPRAFAGRILGPFIKPLVFKDAEPMRRNSPTTAELCVSGEPDFETEREKLQASIDEFVAAGAAGCTKHPHAFFGRLTSEQWGALMYKHLDHHFRQFGG